MKILHIVPGLDDPTNGIAVAAKMIAKRQGADIVDVRQFNSSTSTTQTLKHYSEVWVHSMWLPRTLLACWKVLRLQRENLHSTTTTSDYNSSPRLVRMTHANLDPLRYRYHGWKKRLVAPIERWLFRHTDRVVVTCEAEKKWCQQWGLKNEFEVVDLKKHFDLDKPKGKGEGGKENPSQAGHEWYDIIDPQKILGMPIVDISNAAYLSDRKEIKLAFHAFGRVVNEADGRMVVFPAASAGKMWFNSGTDIRGIAAEFANLFRRSLRAWSEPNAKIPAADKRRKLEAVHQYLSKFSNAGGEYYVRFTVKENIGGKSPRAEVHASVISSIHVYKKTEGAELSIPIKTQAEDSAPFVDNKIALFLGAVNGGNANRDLHLLYLGRRHPLKGVEFLERAVREVNDEVRVMNDEWRKAEFFIVKGEDAPFRRTKDALVWAKATGLIGRMGKCETGGKGVVTISAESIRETLNPRQREKSASDKVHFSALTKLRELIRESKILEVHPDWLKDGSGHRTPLAGENPGISICIAYAAFRFEESLYRVRLTLKRYAQTGTSKAYAYRVNEIEVVPGTLGGKIAPATYPTDTTSICGDILLQGVVDVNGRSGGSKLGFEHSEHSNIRTLDLRIVSAAFGAEKEKIWQWCDVLVLPTLSDNFGLVVAEALERGKRVITTDGAPAWAPPEAAESKSEVEVEQWRDRLVYLRGYRDGTAAERVDLLKRAIAELAGK